MCYKCVKNVNERNLLVSDKSSYFQKIKYFVGETLFFALFKKRENEYKYLIVKQGCIFFRIRYLWAT